MKPVFIIVIAMWMSACTSYQAKLIVPYKTEKYKISIVDQRPETQKEQAIMSLNVSNCQYGSYQIGDENLSPSHIKIFESYLLHHKGRELNGKTIKLKNFTIHVNVSAQLKGTLSNMYGDLLTEALSGKKKVGCSRDDLFGGYTLGELTDNFPPIIAVIDIEIDNKTYHARALKSLEDNTWGTKNPKWDILVQDVIIKASEALVLAMNENIYLDN